MFSGYDAEFDRIFFNSNISYSLMQKNGTFGLGDIFIFICWWPNFNVPFHQHRKYRIWILLILQWLFEWRQNSL